MIREGCRECPVCHEVIKERAKVCRFCGETFTDEPLPRRLPLDQARALDQAERECAALASAAENHRNADYAELTEEEQEALEELHRSVRADYEEVRDALVAEHRTQVEEFARIAEEENRTASVLFVDISGYTSLSEKIRPEYLKRLLDAFYEICARVVASRDGFVVKFEGDACLAVFGAPFPSERAGESAVRAAIEIREMVRRFPVIMGTRIRLSAGVGTGIILTSVSRRSGRTELEIFGPGVNLAGRIESAAESDTVLICPETHRLASEAFRYRRHDPRRLKDIADEVATYEVRGE